MTRSRSPRSRSSTAPSRRLRPRGSRSPSRSCRRARRRPTRASSASGPAPLPPRIRASRVSSSATSRMRRASGRRSTQRPTRTRAPDTYEATLAQLLRHAEGDQPEHPGDRTCARAARRRLQLDEAARVRSRGRRRIPRVGTDDADHGPRRRPSVPESEREPAAAARQRELRRSRLLRHHPARPREAGALRRLRRHCSADDAHRSQARSSTRSGTRRTRTATRSTRASRRHPP